MDLPNIVIFDLDGTLANIDHRKHYIKDKDKVSDWYSFYKACVDDSPVESVASTFMALKQAGHHMVIFSGRSDIVERETVSWLYDNDIDFDRLMMRKEGDFTQDAILKQKWIGNYGYRGKILMVFEDRKQVVDMWRKEGITCFQVAEGNF